VSLALRNGFLPSTWMATQRGLQTPRNDSLLARGLGGHKHGAVCECPPNQVIAEGGEDEFTKTWGTLYDIGGMPAWMESP
jgi:hypothetical protein